MLSLSIGQLTTAAIRGYPNASDRRSQSYPNANDRRGYPIANGLPTGPA